jgi:hypothetical protein
MPRISELTPARRASAFVNESPAARRTRLLAPVIALLVLVALAMAPGIIELLP